MKISTTASWMCCWHDSITGELWRFPQTQLLLVNNRVWVSLLPEQILSKAHNATSETASSENVLEALLDFICSSISVTWINSQKARLFRISQCKIRNDDLLNKHSRFHVTIYYLQQLEYWIKTYRKFNRNKWQFTCFSSKKVWFGDRLFFMKTSHRTSFYLKKRSVKTIRLVIS